MSNTTFASLPGISHATAAALACSGITTPFPIQTQVIPLAVQGGDVLAQAPTGSGKTLAFGLPLLARIEGMADDAPRRGRRQRRGNRLRGLVLVPTRELAVQVCDDLEPLAAAASLRIAAAYGGANINRQATDCAAADVVVATPGRLTDLVERGSVQLGEVQVLVLDEADRMLDMGFAPQVDRIARHVPSRRQTMLFSATLDGAVAKVVERYTSQPDVVRVEPDDNHGENIEHIFEETTHEARIETLVSLLAQPRELAVVFVRTKRGADRLAKKLRAREVSATAIHGGMTQSARLRELAAFRAGTRTTLVATDVFARGIDLDDITHVINYDPPEDADTYRHRIGRTGRAGRPGTGISIVTREQLPHMLAIADEIGLREEACC